MLSGTVPHVLVTVVKTYFSGRVDIEYLPPMLAMQELLSKENGKTVSSLRIVPPEGETLGTMGTSGGGFAAEYSSLPINHEPDSAGEINWKD